MSGGLLGRRLHLGDLVWAGGVALIAMAVTLAYRSALVPTDPWHYVQGALDFPNGTWRPAGLTRWGFLLPIIPFAQVWGDAPATYYVIPLLSTGILAGVLYLLGTRFVSRATGLIGAAAGIGTPIVFVNLSRGYTDLTATMLIGLAILLATLAEDAARDAAQSGRRWGWPVRALLLACGLVTGWSFEVRETAIFAWPVIGWILWRIGRPVQTLVWFVPPALAWLVLDMALTAAIYEDPFLKFRIITGADISESEVSSDADYLGQSWWWYATVLPRSIFLLSAGPTLVVCLAVGMVGGWVFRAQLGRIWAWGMLTLGLLWLQGGPLDPEHPSVRLDVARYWLSFMVPLMLAAVGTVVIAVNRSRGRLRIAAVTGGALLGLAFLVPTVRFVTTYSGFAPNGGDGLAELRADITARGGLPEGLIWTDWGTQRLLPAFQSGPFGDPRWEASGVRSLNRLLTNPATSADLGPQPGDYVVVYGLSGRACWHCQRAMNQVQDAFGPFPAPGWELLFSSSTGSVQLYRLGPDVVWPRPAAGSSGAGPVGSPDEEQLLGTEPGGEGS